MYRLSSAQIGLDPHCTYTYVRHYPYTIFSQYDEAEL